MYDKKVWKNYDFTYEVILLGECVIENDFEKKNQKMQTEQGLNIYFLFVQILIIVYTLNIFQEIV